MRLSPAVFFSLVSLFSLTSVSSQVPSHTPVPPSPPTATPVPPSPESLSKEPYVVESVQNTVRFLPDGKGYRDFLLRVRIQSESAVREFGLLVYPFASSFESLDVLYARVRKPDGTVVETAASDIQELDTAVSREAPMYTDEREKHIAVKSLSAGDTLELHLRWNIRDPIAPGQFWFDHSFFRSGICLSEVLTVDTPRNIAVHYRTSSLTPVVREEGDRRIYAFQSSNLKKPEESKIPNWEKNYYGAEPPEVQFSSFSSWQDVGMWFAGLVQPKISVTPDIRSKALDLTRDKASDDEKISAVYNFVSNHFRYIGVDLGLSRYTPHSASEVLANRYGDCKDKHTLLASLLQALNVSAFPVLISSGFRIDPSFPSPSLFDHVITAIPRGDAFLFLDTTPEVAPFGLLTPSLRNHQALVMPAAAPARLFSVPPDPPVPNYEKVSVDSSIDSQGTLDAKMRLEDRGDSELMLRLAYRATPQNRWTELTQSLVSRMGFGGTVSDVSVTQPEDTSQPFSISFSYHRADLPDWKNHRITFPSPPFLLADLNDEQKRSTEALPLGALQEVTYEATVKLPKGLSLFAPPPESVKKDFAEFSASYSVEKELFHGALRLKTLLHEVPGAERGEFSNLAKIVDDVRRRYIFIGGDFPVAASVAPGNPTFLFSRYIPELEQTLAKDPENEHVLLQLSQAYIRTGRSSEAVSILEKAVAKHSDVSKQMSLALGMAYVHVPDGEKALAQFKKGLGEHPDTDELNEVAYALADANLYLEEALGYSQRAVSDLSADAGDISADDAGLSDFWLMRRLGANWDTLGWIYFRRGDLSHAQKYLEAAWQLMQFQDVGEHLVEVYEKLGKREKAAYICNMALAATNGDPTAHDKLSAEMTRLRPFLKPIHRGNGVTNPQPPDGAVALSDMRMFSVPFHARLKDKSCSAQFVLSISNRGRTDGVTFVSGSEELRNAIAAVSTVKLLQSFPDDTDMKILRKATLNCTVYSTDCTLIIIPVADAAVPASNGVLEQVPPIN